MPDEGIKIINEHQSAIYKEWEEACVQQLIDNYADCWHVTDIHKSLKIIDIGGGAGYFAKALKDLQDKQEREITVLDSSSYDTWDEFADSVRFIKGSADELTSLFESESVDYVFANRVFHHFVRSSWRKSYDGMAEIMKQIHAILRPDGYLCITDYFYNGWFHHSTSSRIIYALTSLKVSPLVKIFRRLDAKTAGIGVCFPSKRMWMDLFKGSGFEIERLKEGRNQTFPLYQRLGLMIRSCLAENVIVLKKAE